MSTDYYEIEYETEVECFEPDYENAHRFVKTTTKLCFIEELPDGIFESPIKKRSELLNLHRLSNNFHYAKVFFKFNYNYSDFSPDSVVIRHSDLDYSDEVTLKGMIRALYDIYYAETHGLKGCLPFINGSFGIAVLGSYERRNEWGKNNEYFYFQYGMYRIYRKVEGFSTPREILTLPDAEKQQKEAPPKKRKSGRKPRKNYPITQDEAAKLITEAWKELGWGRTCSRRNICYWETDPKKKPPFSYKKELRSLLETPKSFKKFIKELIFREMGTPNAKKKMLPLSDNSKEASVEPEVPKI